MSLREYMNFIGSVIPVVSSSYKEYAICTKPKLFENCEYLIDLKCINKRRCPFKKIVI